MQSALAATVALVAGAVAACTAALPPPVPPQFHGEVAVSGGTLGTWQLAPQLGTPVTRDDLEALDLTDPSAPSHVLRLVRVKPPEAEAGPHGIVEVIASREVELRLASTGDSAAEVVLDRDHCSRLDAIFRFVNGHAFGSARFDCDLGASGRATGNVEFAAGSMFGRANLAGHLEASDATLAGSRFEPDEVETDPHGVLFWDHRRPRVMFELEQLPSDASVLGAGNNAKLGVTSTAGSVASFELDAPSCKVLRLDRHTNGYVRVGTTQHTSWGGSVEIDCTTPGGGRLTGSLELK